MAAWNGTKQQVLAILDTLPEETLKEVIEFLDYLQYKLEQRAPRQTPYEPVALGGLWEGVTISDEDIAEVRREMWGDFGGRDL
jgi:hypothetical protein